MGAGQRRRAYAPGIRQPSPQAPRLELRPAPLADRHRRPTAGLADGAGRAGEECVQGGDGADVAGETATMTVLVLYYVPLYALATVIATLAVYWGARFFTDSKWPHRVVLLAAMAWPFGDFALTRLTLYSHCIGEGGTRIYRTVENVEGYASTENGCGGFCMASLIRGDHAHFRFVEARVESATSYGMPLSPGLYRFTVEKPGHPQCKIYDRWLSGMKGLQNNEDFTNNCISVKKIENITARYNHAIKESIINTKFGDISVSSYSIIDSENKQTLAEDISFYMRSKLFWSFAFNPHVCDGGGGNFNVYDVLKPVRA